MEKKLNRGKLIKKYIGEGLKDLGFSYAGYRGDVWMFEKVYKENIIQSVGINIYRFDVWQITFMLATNVPGKMYIDAVHVPGVGGNGMLPGYWKYQDEESLIGALKEMLVFIKEPGMKLLEEASIPEPVYDTSEMHEELYLNHEKLAESFIQKTGIISTGYDRENLERWFDVIEQRVTELQKIDFGAGKSEWLEIAAFLGEQIVKYCGGHWILSTVSERKVCSVGYKIKKCKNVEAEIVLFRLLVGEYLGNGKEWIMRFFLEVINVAEVIKS